MAALNWLATADSLTPAELTVKAQAIPPNDQGRLLWDIFFPRENVNSVRLKDLTALDYRPTADRREWNAQGRRVPLVTPTTREVRIIPIEANFRIDEEEMQRLGEGAGTNEAVLRQAIMADIPARTEMIALSDYRRLEVDSMNAWALGTIVQRNPEDASKTYTASFGFSSGRYTTAGTPWNDASVNAYDLLQTWITSAEDLVGPIEGAMLRLATLNAVLADAPNLPNDVPMTRSALEDRIQQDRGGPFQFYVNENSVDIFDDGGSAYTRTKVWPSQRIAAVPQGRRVGRAAFAPVVRAYELQGVPGVGQGVDVNGVTVYYEFDNSGKGVTVMAQVNAIPIPDEQLLFVTNVGV